jgi:ATP-dependent RNA helicase RhlE
MNFESLGLIEPILKALQEEGYTTPTPIQQQAIPIVLEGRDLLGCAQTGTGKTAAFAIPIIQQLNERQALSKGKKGIKTLVLTPTRELAIQIAESFAAYGRHAGLTHTVIFGGVGQQPQVNQLRRGVDILIATPGRLLDLMNQGFVSLKQLEVFVLDEADRMLDMGFIHDVKKVIAALPAQRQSLFFSATMPPEIVKLSSTILNKPVKVEVTPPSTTAQTINQSLYFVEKGDKKDLLVHLLSDNTIERVLVFTRTKHGANKVVKDLHKFQITAEAIHGNKSQNARQLALKNFKDKSTRVLVATDIAARGIDVDELTHVVNYELPNVPETYVHRIGRTGRAGASGIAISFCESEERAYLKDIQKLIGFQIPVVRDQFYSSPIPETKMDFARPVERHQQRSQSQRPKQNNPQSQKISKQGVQAIEGEVKKKKNSYWKRRG